MRLLCLASLLMLQGCAGLLTWKPVYCSDSPDGKARIQVDIKGCLADCAVQVLVKQGWSSNQVFFKSDCIVNFAHASWSGSRVGLFVDGFYCGQHKLAFDVASRQPIEFKAVEDDLKSSIIKSYSVTSDELKVYDGDVFAWAAYLGDGKRHRSMEEFQKRSNSR